MVKTASNADLVTEIKAGIKKEGSVSCLVSSAICSICGTDNRKSYCRHFRGRSYDKDGGPQVCTFTLDDAVDAYEFSLVAVPAQRAAGVSKSYAGETIFEDELFAEEKKADQNPGSDDTAATVALRVRLGEARDHLNALI